jgi:hypothetical protein
VEEVLLARSKSCQAGSEYLFKVLLLRFVKEALQAWQKKKKKKAKT